MDVICPHCRREFTTWPKSSGKTLSCPNCKGVLSIPIPSAITKQDCESPIFTIHNAHFVYSEKLILIGIGLFVLSFILFCCGVNLYSKAPAGSEIAQIKWLKQLFALFLCSFISMIAGLVSFKRSKKIVCSCGYSGSAEIVSAPSGCGLFLFFCIGIIPGLIYYFIVPTKLACPQCRTLL